MKLAISVVLVCLLAATSVSWAGGYGSAQAGGKPTSEPLSKKPHRTDALNNVVSMEQDGSRTALCVCGKDFPVKADTKSVTHEGTTYYTCSNECSDKAGKLTDADWMTALSPWREKFAATKLVSNAYMKEGHEVAKCACGKLFDVDSRTLAVVENGIVVHSCSAECDAKFRAAGPEGRMPIELAMLPTAKSEQHPSVEVIYRAADGKWTATSEAPAATK